MSIGEQMMANVEKASTRSKFMYYLSAATALKFRPLGRRNVIKFDV